MKATKIVRPVCEPAKITSPYGWRELNGSRQFHDGIDYINAADPGGNWLGDRSVFAIADGVVIYDKDDYDPRQRWTNPDDSAGNFVIIKHLLHGVEYFVRYLHLGENTIAVGEKVTTGQKIGDYADAGYSFGAHLHIDFYDMSWNKVDLTPIMIKGLNASNIKII